jgi:hypothetical protein
MADRERIPVDGGGNLILWSKQEAGATFEGRFLSQRDSQYGSQYGSQYDLETNEGVITLAAATVLTKKMARIRVDGWVTVVYLGTKPSKKSGAHPYHDFDVFVGDQADLLPASTTRAPAGGRW